MIESFASILRSTVVILTMIAVLYVGWQGYQVYQDFAARFAKVFRYFNQLDAIIGQHDQKFSRLERLIDRIRPVEPQLVPDPTPIPIEDTYIEQAPIRKPSEAGRPIVYLYSIEGCGPCEQWWRDIAPLWMQAGWIVERKTSTTSRSTPYWKVWDGTKWMEFDRKLTLETYRQAGGL